MATAASSRLSIRIQQDDDGIVRCTPLLQDYYQQVVQELARQIFEIPLCIQTDFQEMRIAYRDTTRLFYLERLLAQYRDFLISCSYQKESEFSYWKPSLRKERKRQYEAISAAALEQGIQIVSDCPSERKAKILPSESISLMFKRQVFQVVGGSHGNVRSMIRIKRRAREYGVCLLKEYRLITCIIGTIAELRKGIAPLLQKYLTYKQGDQGAYFCFQQEVRQRQLAVAFFASRQGKIVESFDERPKERHSPIFDDCKAQKRSQQVAFARRAGVSCPETTKRIKTEPASSDDWQQYLKEEYRFLKIEQGRELESQRLLDSKAGDAPLHSSRDAVCSPSAVCDTRR